MKAVCLLSGGIDSPVAVQIAINLGFQPYLLHYHNYPFHSLGTLEKVIEISNKIALNNLDENISLIIIPHGKSQEIILNQLHDKEIRQTCLFCRIQMFRKAEYYAKKVSADIIVTGEILGEQASQTLSNLPLVNAEIDIPVVRPLIGYNKKEVVELSKKYGYYHASILPGGCCSVNPRFPETQGNKKTVDTIFERIVLNLNNSMKEELSQLLEFSLPGEANQILESIRV
ncbi:7-cyano-7-deazaguanine synthase [Candidatus Hodarchaeum mangrovi]